MYYASLCIRDIEYGQGRTIFTFALSTPMEVLYIGNEPSHTSPAMYTGIPAVDLSDSWGIDNREDLIQTIYRMTDDGHAADLAPFISAGLRYLLINGANSPHSLANRARFMRDLLPKPHYAAGVAALKPGTMCVWGFMPDGVLNQWLTEEESLWLQSRIYARAYYFTTVGRNILPPIRWVGCTGRLKGTPYRHISLT